MADPTLFDAISGAIESDGTVTPGVTDADTSTVEDAADDTAGVVEEGGDTNVDGSAAGDDQGGEQGGEDADGDQPGGEDGEDAEGAAGAARGADGKFVKKGEQPAADKVGKDGKPAAKAPDHVNDPIPKDLKPATQERMRFLVNETKKLAGEREKIQTDFNYMIEGIKATGTTPDQYREVLSFMSLFNSQDPAQQEKALELIESVADRLALVLGKDRSVSDPLAAHADLKADVAGGKLTAERAKEIARFRNQGAFRTELTTAQRQEQDQANALTAAREGARQTLNDLEVQLRATDRNYEAIKARIMPALKPVFATLHPSKWHAAFQQAYDNVKATLATNTRPRNPGNQPLRAGGGQGGSGGQGGGDMKSQPKSMLDAVSAALDGM